MAMTYGSQIEALKTPDILYDLYVNQKKSMRTIARELGCGETVINKYIYRYNIPMRTHSDAAKLYKRTKEHTQKITESIIRNGSLKGPKHPNWQGGKTSENQRARAHRWYRNLMKDAIKRDNHECQLCGEVDGVMHAHHIKKFSIYMQDRYMMTNLITLCQTCHRLVHHLNGESVCF